VHFDKGVEPHVIWVHVNNHQVLRELSAAQNYSIPTNGEPHIQCAYRINPINRETQKNKKGHLLLFFCVLHLQQHGISVSKMKAQQQTYIAIKGKPSSQHNGSIPVSFSFQHQHKLHTSAW
jgi:hypothetical protein